MDNCLSAGSATRGWAARLLAIVFLVLAPAPVLAHGVYLSAYAEGNSICGKVTFHGDLPAENVKITAFDSAGEKADETTTDENGEYRLKAAGPGDYRLLAQTEDGHPAEASVHVTTPAGDRLEALEEKIVQLQNQLSGYEQKTRLRDVLGGIGYIVGVAGIAFYFLGVRRQQRNDE